MGLQTHQYWDGEPYFEIVWLIYLSLQDSFA